LGRPSNNSEVNVRDDVFKVLRAAKQNDPLSSRNDSLSLWFEVINRYLSDGLKFTKEEIGYYQEEINAFKGSLSHGSIMRHRRAYFNQITSLAQGRLLEKAAGVGTNNEMSLISAAQGISAELRAKAKRALASRKRHAKKIKAAFG
jgi:hypothetical protein